MNAICKFGRTFIALKWPRYCSTVAIIGGNMWQINNSDVLFADVLAGTDAGSTRNCIAPVTLANVVGSICWSIGSLDLFACRPVDDQICLSVHDLLIVQSVLSAEPSS